MSDDKAQCGYDLHFDSPVRTDDVVRLLVVDKLDMDAELLLPLGPSQDGDTYSVTAVRGDEDYFTLTYQLEGGHNPNPSSHASKTFHINGPGKDITPEMIAELQSELSGR